MSVSIYKMLEDAELDLEDDHHIEEGLLHGDLDDLLAEAAHSTISTESTPYGGPAKTEQINELRPTTSAESWEHDESHFHDEGEVPESLLLGDRKPIPATSRPRVPVPRQQPPQELPVPIPGPSQIPSRTGFQDRRVSFAGLRKRVTVSAGLVGQAGSMLGDRAEQALWKWTNLDNLDNFLVNAYNYYVGKGIWSIVLGDVLELIRLAFIWILLSYLTFCINYSKIRGAKTLPEVVVPQCTQKISGISNVVIWLLSFYWLYRFFQSASRMRRLYEMHDFYHHLLDIPDIEMQTISWPAVVSRIMNLRDQNPRTATNLSAPARDLIGKHAKQRMDAHDIANRIMRKDNYLIALINKDILDLNIPVPFLGDRQLFSSTLGWNIGQSIMDFVFSDRGQVRQLFLKETFRQQLIDQLNIRLKFAAVMSILSTPASLTYLVANYVLRFFVEFQRNPAALGARSYTPLAYWKFREFNEVQHMFDRRIDMSVPFASRYIDQFPKFKTSQVAALVSFVSGALASVLGLCTLLDPDLFLSFEITPDKTALFWLGILVPIWAASRNMVPEENLVFDPEFAIEKVIDFTHYKPTHWKGRLHTDEVRQEFAQLYRPKVLNFLEEVASVITTPYILFFCLPRCTPRLVDFFREFTVHVDGLGYICSFALFEFKKGGPNANTTKPNSARPGSQDPREEYYSTKDNKMLASYFNFIDNYSNNPRKPMPREGQPRDFNPPPSFPGITSSQMTITEGNSKRRAQDPLPNLAASIFREGHKNPLTTGISPSLVLDPRHQPAAALGQSRIGRSHEPSRLRHTEVVNSQAEASTTEASEAGNIEESVLGDSWRTTRAAADEEDVSEAESMPGTGEGVLGMIYQFQKAQATGRGTLDV
jgi:autophagy-related protein 9